MGKVRGIPEAMVKLEKEIHAVKNRSLKGLITVQAKIYNDMDNIPPKIPVDLENLRQSYYAVASSGHIKRGEHATFDNSRGDASTLRSDHRVALKFAKKAAVADGKARGPTIVMGFSAYYAEVVHEMYDSHFHKPVNWTRSGSGPGFFGTAVKNNVDFMRKVLRETVKIPK